MLLGDEHVTCPLCRQSDTGLWAKARDVEYRSTEDEYSFYRCAACDVLFIHPVPEDKLNTIYPANYYSFITDTRASVADAVKEWLDKRRFKKVARALKGDKLTALDVGGGSGWLLDKLKSADSRVKHTQVVDLDAAARAAAEAKGHKYFKGRFEEFEPDQKFDIILMLNLIEHVADPGAMLKKAAALLSDDGVILIKTPNFNALDARLYRHANWGGYHCPRHWVLFSKESFTLLSNQCGLKADAFSYTQGAPFWSVSVLAWLDKRGMIKITPARPASAHPLYGVLCGLFAAFDLVRAPFSPTSQMFFLLKKA